MRTRPVEYGEARKLKGKYVLDNKTGKICKVVDDKLARSSDIQLLLQDFPKSYWRDYRFLEVVEP